MILVTGANGQLGSDVCSILEKQSVPHYGIDKNELDITDKEAVAAFFEKNNISAVIHCAAYTAVDKAEDDCDNCYKINHIGTLNIAEQCKKNDTKIIYVSTDYVFTGEGSVPFETSDKKGPLNVYGKSKLLGEKAVKELCRKYFIVRTSWVFGEKNTNFIHTMLRLSENHESVNVVCDQIGSPTYSKHLAFLLCQMIRTEKYGEYHASNEGCCSWAELAKEVFALSKKSTVVIPITSEKFASKAKRPRNSRLSKTSLDIAGFSRLPSWQSAVKEYLQID